MYKNVLAIILGIAMTLVAVAVLVTPVPAHSQTADAPQSYEQSVDEFEGFAPSGYAEWPGICYDRGALQSLLDIVDANGMVDAEEFAAWMESPDATNCVIGPSVLLMEEDPYLATKSARGHLFLVYRVLHPEFGYGFWFTLYPGVGV